jgi:hypothetical protein
LSCDAQRLANSLVFNTAGHGCQNHTREHDSEMDLPTEYHGVRPIPSDVRSELGFPKFFVINKRITLQQLSWTTGTWDIPKDLLLQLSPLAFCMIVFLDTRYDSFGRAISPSQRPLPTKDTTTYPCLETLSKLRTSGVVPAVIPNQKYSNVPEFDYQRLRIYCSFLRPWNIHLVQRSQVISKATEKSGDLKGQMISGDLKGHGEVW